MPQVPPPCALEVLRRRVEDFDTAHVAGVRAVVVSARQPHWHLRHTAAAADASEGDANIVHVCGAIGVVDVDGATEAVASRRRVGGDSATTASLERLHLQLLAAHRYHELLVGECRRDRTVLASHAVSERTDVPDLIPDVSLAAGYDTATSWSEQLKRQLTGDYELPATYW